MVAGGTGYLGRPLIERLSRDGVQVKAIVRAQSLAKLPGGCEPVAGDVLDASTYWDRLPRGATFVHLVGVPHPAPWKAAQFRAVDLVALRESVIAAQHTNAEHFIFVSVAHPAPVMRAYIQVRSECEDILRRSGLNTTILRPWYILGPGHRWPSLLLPIYRVLEAIPSTRESAIRLGLVKQSQMIEALVSAVAAGSPGFRILETAAIRACAP